jgi:hypothetical protein
MTGGRGEWSECLYDVQEKNDLSGTGTWSDNLYEEVLEFCRVDLFFLIEKCG